MKGPIAPLLAAFASGATALQACPRLPPMPAELCIAMAFMMIATLRLHAQLARRAQSGPTCAPPLTLIAAFAPVLVAALAGFSYAAWRAEVRLADELPTSWEERDVRVTGIVDDLPQQFPTGVRFALAIGEVHTAGAVLPARASLAWFAPRTQREPSAADDVVAVSAPSVHAGECWALTIRLKRPHGNINPDGFDLEAWLLEQGLRATGYVRESSANVRQCAFAGRFSDRVQRAREHIRARIAAALPNAPYAGVLTALTIGDQRAIPESQWSVFNRTGVTHLVSISGLHVTVFATLAGACAYAAFRRSTKLTSRVPARKLAALVGALFALAYVLLAGAEVPAVRTLLMLVVAAVGLWLGRPGTAMLVWLWSLAVVVVWDPWASLAPGFWLSFGAVGLLLYTGSGRLRVGAPATLRARCVTSLRESAQAQWVVTLGLVPGTLALFQQVSLVSALANAVAIPTITLGVVPLALLPIALPVDTPWQVAHWVLTGLMHYLEWAAALPAATWVSHAPRGWTVVVAMAGVAWLLAPRGVPGRALGSLLLGPLVLLPPNPVPFGGVRVVVLDVGQGLAVFVATAQHALLYDTGPRVNETVDAGGRIILPFLRATGVGRLDVLIVSHADSDHSGGASSVLKGVPVGKLVSSLPANHALIAQSGAREGPSVRCTEGARWTWDGVTFTMLHPSLADYDDHARKGNDLSCVLKIDAAGGGILLTGDIEAPAEGELLAREARAVRSDVLVVPHHGSRTSSTNAFVAGVSPSVAVIAAGYRNRFGHPRSDVLGRYRRFGASRPRTDLQGAITVSIAPDGAITTYGERERRRRYWYDAPPPADGGG